jgi:membrane peptidoglycan carboxypeptidase
MTADGEPLSSNKDDVSVVRGSATPDNVAKGPIWRQARGYTGGEASIRAAAPGGPRGTAPVPPPRTRYDATVPANPGAEPLGPEQIRKKKADRRNILVAAIAVILLLSGLGLAAGTYYFDSVPTPEQLTLPEATTVYYADGKTPMAQLGSENRTLLKYDEMNDAVRNSIVAAEDQTFWTNSGIDFKGVLRAAWNNVTGGDTQGASTITQQYARVAAELTGVTYSRKLREAVIAWKLADKYDKKAILEFYLNTVPFGRGAYGIEAAAQAYLGKTANRNAPPQQQITLAEAMVLVAMVKQPYPNPNDPQGAPGYDPTRGPVALQNSKDRWNYVRGGLVTTRAITQAEADALRYPDTVKPYDPNAKQSSLNGPVGLAVSHVLSELRQTDLFRDKPKGYLQDGGFRIITTIDKRAQDAAEAAADITRDTAPAELRGQPKNWQAALVAVEPGTGRVLAYYGGNEGSGSDYAGWYYGEDGKAVGFGAHPPGSSFKVYDLAEALHQNIPLETHFDSPATKEFPASGRTKASPNGPVRNASTAACQPSCSLVDATVASLNVPFFDLTEKLGTGNVIEMAAKSGIDNMWANVAGQPQPVRTDLRGKAGKDLAPSFSTEVGIGQYGVTVVDHANGLATLAAGGKRAQAHFVRSVEKNSEPVYGENLNQTDIGLTQDQSDQLNAALKKVTAGDFSKDWDAAAKTGTWQAGTSTTQNAHTWIVGYTRAIAAAVWLGTTDGKALVTKNGKSDVYGANYPGPIWRQFMTAVTKAMGFSKDLARFNKPKAATSAPSGPGPSERSTGPTVEPSPLVSAIPTPGVPTPTPRPSGTIPPTTVPASGPVASPTNPPQGNKSKSPQN